MTDLITEHEAAIFLGVTKELLLSFVKTAVKGQKLPIHSKQGKLLFSKAELKHWDEFLHQPWAEKGSKRIEIPLIIKEYLKVESGGKCARCGSGHRLDNAHIDPWNISYSHHPHNLIRLCTDCHIKYDDQIIGEEEIRDLKQKAINGVKAAILAHIGLSANQPQMPPLSSSFQGRQKELQELQVLFGRDRCILIQGVGGMGKTQLLIKFLQGKELPVEWFDLEQYDGLQDVQVALAKRFYTASLAELATVIDESRTVLVLDGFEKLLAGEWDRSVAFVNELIRLTKVARILVASQVDFTDAGSGISSLKLNSGLSAAESEELLVLYHPSLPLKDEYTGRLITFTDGHPLTLVILSSLIKFLKTPQVVWEGLEEAGSKLLNTPQRRAQNKSTSLEISLILSFDLLGATEQWLLKYLALFPAGHKVYFLERLINGDDKVFQHKTALKMSVAVLDQFNLIGFYDDPLGFERTTMLSPIRSFVLAQTAKDQKELHQIRLIAFEAQMMEAYVLFTKYLLSEQVEYAIARYDHDLLNYVYAFRAAVHTAYADEDQSYIDRKAYLRIITGMASSLYKFLFTRGHFEYAFYFNEQGAKAHVELGEYALAIDDLLQLATLHYRRYDLVKAQAVLYTILAYEKKSGKRHPLVRLLEGQLLMAKEPQKAITIFKEGLKLNERQMSNDDLDHAKSNSSGLLMQIGRAYEMSLRDDRSALPYYLKAYAIQKKLKDYGNLYTISHHLGNTYTGLNDAVNGLFYYTESLLGFIRLGQQQYISNSLSEIGKLRIDHPELDYSFVDANVAEAGLADIAREVKLSFGQGGENFSYMAGKLPTEVIYKLWNIIKLISLSAHGGQLDPWAVELKEWLEDKLEAAPGKPAPYPWIFLKIAEVTVIVRSEPKNEDALMFLKWLCYLNGSEYDHDTMDPFEWLALWLREHHIDDDASRDGLFAEMEDY